MLKNIKNKRWSLFKKLGPGFITGASDDDPSGLTTYAQSGAQFGTKVLWTSLWTLPLMVSVQEMSARIGMVSGGGMTRALLHKFSRWMVALMVMLLVVANTINIGADIAGMAESVTLIVGIPFYLAAIVLTIVMIALEIFLPYKKYVVILKWCTISLFSYIAAACVVNISWSTVLYHTIIPSLDFCGKDSWYILIAILGTTISPYLIFWQSCEEVEEKIARNVNPDRSEAGQGFLRGPIVKDDSRVGATKQEVREMRQETWIGMFFSNTIMFFVMAVTASVLYGTNGSINSMAGAAAVLKPLAGPYASWLFTFGVVGTGLLAIPVLAGSSAYAMAELFNWKEGLYLKWNKAYGFYGVILISTLVGLVSNFLGFNTVDFLIWSAVINGVVVPFLIIAMLFVANDQKILGEHVNSRQSNFWGWATVVIFVGSIAGFLLAHYVC